MCLLPGGGRGYLSKMFSGEWLADYGLPRPGSPPSGVRVQRDPAGDPDRPAGQVRAAAAVRFEV
jgi:hypothetical protein